MSVFLWIWESLKYALFFFRFECFGVAPVWERKSTYAVGHLALGYLTGRAADRLLNLNVNICLLFLASIMPDIDLLIPGLKHRGPTHSLIISILIFIPFVMYYGKKAVAYFVAFTQHSLIGDYVIGGGVQLLWPINSTYYFGLEIEMVSLVNIVLEWTFFLVCFALLLKTRDVWTMLQPHSSNLALSIPVFTVLLPTIIAFPLYVPLLLVIPHLIYLVLFTMSIVIDLEAILTKS